MRIIATIATDQIVQVEKTPLIGVQNPKNGMYSIPVPEGVQVDVRPESVVLPTSDPNSIVGQSYAGLLAKYPQYQHILFNPLIEGADMDDLDPTGVLNEGVPVTASYASRLQMGRGTGGPLASGTAPNSCAVLAQNNGASPSKPGVVVTNTIDISALTGGVGASEFCVYWYIYDFETTSDVRSEYGATAGQNTPSLRLLSETDQTPTTLDAYLSINDGANFVPIDRLIPVGFCAPGTQLRIAWKNTDTVRRYLAGYAVMF